MYCEFFYVNLFPFAPNVLHIVIVISIANQHCTFLPGKIFYNLALTLDTTVQSLYLLL